MYPLSKKCSLILNKFVISTNISNLQKMFMNLKKNLYFKKCSLMQKNHELEKCS